MAASSMYEPCSTESTPASAAQRIPSAPWGVRCDLSAEPVGVGNDRLHLIERVLRVLRIVAQRQDASGRANFDQIRAILNVLADLMLDCRDTIGHAIFGGVEFERQHVVIAMTACNAQCRTTNQHPRSRDITGVNGIA